VRLPQNDGNDKHEERQMNRTELDRLIASIKCSIEYANKEADRNQKVGNTALMTIYSSQAGGLKIALAHVERAITESSVARLCSQ